MSYSDHETVTAHVTEDNSTMLKKLLFFTVLMFGFSYAMVPMYEKICEVTGIRKPVADMEIVGTETKSADITRAVTIELDANAHSRLLQFKPLQSSVQTQLGEFIEVTYEVKNNSNRAITGQAIPSYSPRNLEKYLKKIECFCFTKQVIEPNEVKQMPVTFAIDPQIPVDVNTVTISYTFYILDSDT
ncbi:MAG: cytochrome c oxidase assembly protein [Burkholderiales bacterium]|nr:cytochrome c oxidase assembly protein [Nitrosomonas sp.]MCP5274108.1 cytochrome c oxidase assembly protein [Burkholderiales bacterium]